MAIIKAYNEDLNLHRKKRIKELVLRCVPKRFRPRISHREETVFVGLTRVSNAPNSIAVVIVDDTGIRLQSGRLMRITHPSGRGAYFRPQCSVVDGYFQVSDSYISRLIIN